ncbi:hypothetical protein HDU76_011649, partial [Blyttiomyces sp. JEL0837]
MSDPSSTTTATSGSLRRRSTSRSRSSSQHRNQADSSDHDPSKEPRGRSRVGSSSDKSTSSTIVPVHPSVALVSPNAIFPTTFAVGVGGPPISSIGSSDLPPNPVPPQSPAHWTPTQIRSRSRPRLLAGSGNSLSLASLSLDNSSSGGGGMGSAGSLDGYGNSSMNGMIGAGAASGGNNNNNNNNNAGSGSWRGMISISNLLRRTTPAPDDDYVSDNKSEKSLGRPTSPASPTVGSGRNWLGSFLSRGASESKID